MKHVQVGLSARDDRESNLHRCGCPVRLVQVCLCAEKADNAILTSEGVL